MNRIFLKNLGTVWKSRKSLLFPIRNPFCERKDDAEGTDYSNWVLARSAAHNHNIEHMKRKHVKDRYSIHRLTNLSFML